MLLRRPGVVLVCSIVGATYTAIGVVEAYGRRDWGWFVFLVTMFAVAAGALFSVARGYRRRRQAKRAGGVEGDSARP